MLVKWLAALGLLLGAATVFAEDLGPESNRRNDVYFTEEQARQKVYGRGLEWIDTVIHVDSLMRAALYEQTGHAEADSTVRFGYALGEDGRLVGSYHIASEIGKYLPFEFLVALDENLHVKDIVVLNYRESRGGEVRRERFVRQYRGKDAADPVSLNRDIIGISGATLSAQAINRGVKKTLWWAMQLWPEASDKE
jgi:hypothetical protein